MVVALPALFFVLAAAYAAARDEWRVAWMKAAVMTGVVVVAITEALSLANLLSLPQVAAAWAAACGIAAGLVWRRRVDLVGRWRLLLTLPRPLLVLAPLVPVAVIVLATALVALVSPPNNYDSMTYHMARVAHWAADGTVALYPTNILRQLDQPPWAEFAVLQLQVLSGGDHYANLVQWFSMLSCTVGVSLIAQKLGAPARGQVLAATAAAALPMGILQASSTQTDYVVALWLVCAVSMALRFVADRSLASACWFAASLGLALLTKGTAYVYAAPLVILLGYWMVTRLRRQVIVPGLVMILIPLVINSGYYLRNQALFQNPLSPHQETAALVNDSFTPQAVVSNVIRDAVLQFGTPSAAVNHTVMRAITWVHADVLHIGPNDPRTTWPGVTFQVNPLSFDEDYAGNPLQALLGLAAVLAGIGYALRRGPPLMGLYAAALTLAFLVFAGYLKWQPWSSRLELPLLVLTMPLLGAVLSRRFGFTVAFLVGAVLVISAMPWVIDNQTRPLVGLAIYPGSRTLPVGETIFNTSPTDLYFVKRPDLEVPYASAVNEAERLGCSEIGLWAGQDDWEYPLWALATRSGDKLRIDQVFVTNESAHAARFGSRPCLLVSLTPEQPPNVDLDGVGFTQIWLQGGVGLYEPTPTH